MVMRNENCLKFATKTANFDNKELLINLLLIKLLIIVIKLNNFQKIVYIDMYAQFCM